jgi:predicted oxidoreductase (fatty acid repression mutant protein)
MRAMRLFHYASAIALPVALSTAGCSSSASTATSSDPVIDSLQVPATFTVSGTQYSVTGTITFHDDSAVITTLHEKIPAYQLDSTVSITGASEQGTAQILLGFVATSAVASGTNVEIDVSLIDADGKESNVEVETIAVP